MKPVWLTGYSASHAVIYAKHFRPSWLGVGLQDHFEFRLHSIPGEPGEFGTEGFNTWGRWEMQQTLERIKSHMGNIVVTSGVDFHFYQPIGEELIQLSKNHEFVAANDVYFEACGDFNCFRVTDRIIKLYEWILYNDHKHANQEFTLNHGLQEMGFGVLSLSRDYWTVGMGNAGMEWTPGDEVKEIPKTIKVHHGNFTRGAHNKLCLLGEVQSIINSQCQPQE